MVASRLWWQSCTTCLVVGSVPSAADCDVPVCCNLFSRLQLKSHPTVCNGSCLAAHLKSVNLLLLLLKQLLPGNLVLEHLQDKGNGGKGLAWHLLCTYLHFLKMHRQHLDNSAACCLSTPPAWLKPFNMMVWLCAVLAQGPHLLYFPLLAPLEHLQLMLLLGNHC